LFSPPPMSLFFFLPSFFSFIFQFLFYELSSFFISIFFLCHFLPFFVFSIPFFKTCNNNVNIYYKIVLRLNVLNTPTFFYQTAIEEEDNLENTCRVSRQSLFLDKPLNIFEISFELLHTGVACLPGKTMSKFAHTISLLFMM
jgi:hypothetical protein